MMTTEGVDQLPAETRRWLLGWARGSIARHLSGEPSQDPLPVPGGAEVARGCFVSLHSTARELRGCIGTFATDAPLWCNVRDMAVAAACRDPRFLPLEAQETYCIEISALTPPRPARAHEIEVGRHGICIQRGQRRGVLLPQVAVDHGWDRTAFLEHTCVKAGLPRDAWRGEDARIEVFGAEIFAET